jgi:biotin carboxylase
MGTDLVFVELNMNGYGTYGVELARRQGLTTRLLSRNPEEYGRLTPNPALMVDAVDRVETYDVPKLLRHIDRLRPAAVIAYDDYRLVETSVVASTLGLPGPEPVGVLNCRFKDATRRATQGIGREVRYTLVDLGAGAQTSPLGYPCVVKPVDDSASTGVLICDSDEEFVAAVTRAIDHATHARGYRCVDSVLVEEYVAGAEFSAELLWDDVAQRWRLLGFVETVLSDPPACKEIAHVFPARLDAATARAAEDIVLRWLDATGHRGTAAHVEFKLCEDGQFALMEINPRLGGGEIRLLLARTLDIDVIDLYQRLWRGVPVDLPAQFDTAQHSVVRYLTPPRPGLVRRLELSAAPRPEVVDCHLNAVRIEGVNATTNSRLGWVVTQHAEPARAVAAAEDVHAATVFEYVS